MSDEPFTHDAAGFTPLASPSSVEVSDASARYAALFAEVIWDGLITPEKRRQLRTAAELLGLPEAEVQPIEQALLAAHEERHRVAVIEERTEEEERRESREARRSRRSLAPFASYPEGRDSFDELRVTALTARVDALEADNARLVVEGERAAQENERLTELLATLEIELADMFEEFEALHAARAIEAAPAASAESATLASPAVEAAPAASAESATLASPAVEAAPAESEESATLASPAVEAAGGTSPRASRPRIDVHAQSRYRSRRAIAQGTPRAAARAESASSGVPSARLVSVVAPTPRLAVPRNDPAELHRLIRRSPTDPDLLRALFRSLQRADDLDRRVCIAQALVHLREANDQERATYAAYAGDALVRPRRALDDEEWRDLLLHPDQDRIVGDTLAEVAPAVLLGHVTALRASLAPEALDPSRLVDPQTSTEASVRCLGWAAAILGVKLPPIYLARELDRTADVVLTPKPATRLGARALTGRSPRELAFLAGQHLAWFRREHLLAQPSTSVRRLEDWIVAAFRVANPDIPLASETRERIEPLAVTIKPLLGEPALARLRRSLGRFLERGARLEVAQWLESVEHTVACAGLLLSNDFAAAEAMLRLDGSPSFDAVMGELIVFHTSKRCGELRRRIGTAIDA
ncbi:MAG: hypothetical protein FJ096_00825 [Deltaproteobacteria bacterium]|nr:hypothetical protein [Deltaproteobacteria bacterium]